MASSPSTQSGAQRLPVADGLPLIGSLIPMLGNPISFMTAQYHKHGSVFLVKVLNRRITVFAGPEAVEYMTTEDDTLTGEPLWTPLVNLFGGKNNLTALDGEEHSRLRKVMRRGFSRTAALDTIPVTIETTRRVLRGDSPGSLINVGEFTTRLIAEVIGSITLGKSAGEYLPDFVTVWRNYLWSHVLGSKPKSVMESPEVKKALVRVTEMANGILEAYQKGELKPGESQFADDLITASKEQPDFVGHGDLILGLIAPYVAGLDTVASIVLFMLYEVYRDATLKQRLLADIKPLFANGVPAPDQLRNIPVLHATVLETLRFYNVGGMLPRVAKKDFEFSGFRIAKGNSLQMAVGVVHRMEKFYKQPERFDIDRFLEPRNEHKQRYAFAPYGAGAHTCLGAGMAEVIIALMMATLINEADFSIEPADYKIKGFLSADLKPAPDFRLKLNGFSS